MPVDYMEGGCEPAGLPPTVKSKNTLSVTSGSAWALHAEGLMKLLLQSDHLTSLCNIHVECAMIEALHPRYTVNEAKWFTFQGRAGEKLQAGQYRISW